MPEAQLTSNNSENFVSTHSLIYRVSLVGNKAAAFLILTARPQKALRRIVRQAIDSSIEHGSARHLIRSEVTFCKLD